MATQPVSAHQAVSTSPNSCKTWLFLVWQKNQPLDLRFKVLLQLVQLLQPNPNPFRKSWSFQLWFTCAFGRETSSSPNSSTPSPNLNPLFSPLATVLLSFFCFLGSECSSKLAVWVWVRFLVLGCWLCVCPEAAAFQQGWLDPPSWSVAKVVACQRSGQPPALPKALQLLGNTVFQTFDGSDLVCSSLAEEPANLCWCWHSASASGAQPLTLPRSWESDFSWFCSNTSPLAQVLDFGTCALLVWQRN